jgi:hypothetical protein
LKVESKWLDPSASIDNARLDTPATFQAALA